MLQKEVADRLVARVGTGEYGVLTILTAFRADVTCVCSRFRRAPFGQRQRSIPRSCD